MTLAAALEYAHSNAALFAYSSIYEAITLKAEPTTRAESEFPARLLQNHRGMGTGQRSLA